MRYYETLYIVDPNLDNSILEKTMTEIEKELSKTKSKVINHRIWDKKRLAYKILNHKYGSYIILQFEAGDLAKMQDFDVWMKLNNIVLRHMTVLLSQKPEIYKEPISELENKKEEADPVEKKKSNSSVEDEQSYTKENEPLVELDEAKENE
tara:strand:- start:237 stop:689 length:453 start_codon:yes stop_codon:yes gene_type:complete